MIQVSLKETKEIYPILKEWAGVRSFPLPPLSFLPTYTAVVFDELGDMVYTTCIYHTDSEVMWLGWELSNPHKDKDLRKKSFTHILKFIEGYAKSNEYKHIITTSGTPPVENGLRVAGFLEADKNINQYIKNI